MKNNKGRLGRNWSKLVQLCFAFAMLTGSSASYAERHEGYYFPALTSSETYEARAKTFERSTPSRTRSFSIAEIEDKVIPITKLNEDAHSRLLLVRIVS